MALQLKSVPLHLKKAENIKLQRIINMGMLNEIAKPMETLMQFFAEKNKEELEQILGR